MDMAAILSNDAEPSVQSVNIPSTEGPRWNLVKIGQVVLEKTFKNFMVLYLYIAQGQGQITPGGKISILSKTFYYFNHTLQVSAISLKYILKKKWFFNSPPQPPTNL